MFYHMLLCCSIVSLLHPIDGTLISNVNLVFETFNPVSMVRFFEFNDKGWNISAGCIQDMFHYLDGLHRDISWAMRLYDASGYYAGGLFDGNHIRSGNPALCRRLNGEHHQQLRQLHQRQQFLRRRTTHSVSNSTTTTTTTTTSTRTPLRHTTAPTVVYNVTGPAAASAAMFPFNESSARQPFAVHLIHARYTLHLDGQMQDASSAAAMLSSGRTAATSTTVQQIVCMPLSCGFDDLKQVMSYAHLPHMRTAAQVRHAELAALRVIGGSKYAIWEDMGFYALCLITTMILSLMLIAAIYEWCVEMSAAKKAKAAQQNAPKPERFSFCAKTSFISHVDVDKCSSRSTGDSTSGSTLSRNLNGSDQLLDSLIINNFNSATNCNEKQDNIMLAKSLELQQQQHASFCSTVSSNNSTLQPCTLNGSPTDTTFRNDTAAESLPAQLIGSFSWRRNMEWLCSDACDTTYAADIGDRPVESIADDVRFIGGLKVLCCLSIVLVHVCVFVVHVSSNKTFVEHSSFVASLLENGTLTIDVFFFLSGISMAHMFYTTARIIDVHQIAGAFDQLLLFASMVLYKLLRLTFPYMVVLITLQLTAKHFHDNATLDVSSEDHTTCQQHMWRNILYIDTFYPVSKRCMVWSWYISLEAQLCLGASIILLLSRTHPRYASIISTSFFTSSIMTSTILRYNQRLGESYHDVIGGMSATDTTETAGYQHQLVAFNGLYDQPWTRISPYLLGLCLGYILHRSKRTFRMHIVIVVLGNSLAQPSWLACLCMIIGFAFKQLYITKLSAWLRASVAATTNTVCSMILFWLVLASVSQHGGRLGSMLVSARWRPFSKLSNCVLLVHPLVTRWLLLGLDHGVHASDGLVVLFYVGFVVLIYAVAFMLYMLFEAPFAAVFHILYYRNFK